MQRRVNSWLTGSWWLVAFALALTIGRTQAASSSENNAWTAANKSFREQMWPRAEDDYAKFLKKYPDSEYYALAVLGEAQARFKLAETKALKDPAGVPAV